MNPLLLHTGRGQMAQELGKQFDTQRAAAVDECRRNEGAIGALTQALDSLDALRPRYREATQQSEISAESGKVVMVALDDATCCLEELKTSAERNMMAQRGKVAQIESVLDSCQRAFDAEIDAISQVQKAEEEASSDKTLPLRSKEPKKRATGEHPGKSIAERRAQGQD